MKDLNKKTKVELISIIEELEFELKKLKEDLENLQNDLESNYKKIDCYELYGISESDFI